MRDASLKNIFFAGVLVAAVLLPVVSFAIYLPPNNWVGSVITDGGITVGTGTTDDLKRDITQAMWTYDATKFYFRLDLKSTTLSNTHYEILLDGPGAGVTYPSEGSLNASSIDYVLWRKGGSYGLMDSGGNPISVASMFFQNTENGGKTLEWSFNKSDFAGTYYFYGATAVANGKSLYDLTSISPQPTPIPNAAWLLGGGVVALIGLKRRKTKT